MLKKTTKPSLTIDTTTKTTRATKMFLQRDL